MAIAPIELSAIAAGTGGFVIVGAAAGEYAGGSVAFAGDINGDGFADLIIGAERADSFAGRSYVVFGTAGGFAAPVEMSAIAAGSGGFVIQGQANDGAGRSVSTAGDLNGDGFADLIIGARYASGGAGRSYVVFGKASGFGAQVDLSAIAAGSGGFVMDGESGGDQLGFSVASAGDLNGDGFDDLIVGAFSVSGSNRSYVVFGKSDSFGAAVDLTAIAAGTGGFAIQGQAGEFAGFSVASAGDLNGDGLDDLVVGAPFANGQAGRSYVVFGKTGGFGALVDLTAIAAGTGGFVLAGQAGGDYSGLSVATAGDINGDGFADLILGAPSAGGNAGRSYVVFGTAGGFGASIDLSAIAAGTGGFAIAGQAAGDRLGYSVAAAGDVNGDGFDDLIIGAYGANSQAGRSYVVFGKAGGFGASVDLSAIAAGTGGFAIEGQAFDFAGRSVASAGDVDGDGFGDLIIGAPSAAGGAGSGYVVLGRDFTGTVTHAGTAGDNTLTGTGGADDIVGGQGDDTLDGNGGADVLLGGAGGDTIRVSDLAFQRIDGGSGADTLALTGAGMTLDLTAVPTTRLREIERIDLTGTGNNQLRLTALDVLNLSGTTNTLRVDGNAADRVRFMDTGWARGASVSGYTTWTNGQARVETSTALFVTVGLPAVDLIEITAGTGGFAIPGVTGFSATGRAVGAAGDVNGDGFGDILIGAPRADGSAGRSYVVFGQAGGFGALVDLAAISAGTGGFTIAGEAGIGAAGSSVSAGDINGDGLADLIIGAPQRDNYAGRSYVVFGTSGGFGATIDLATVAAGTGGLVLKGEVSTDFSGWSVASGGDIDGDGFDDLLIGAPYRSASPGRSYVVFGKAGGFGSEIDLASVAMGTGGFAMLGQAAGDGFATSIASAGDVNGDGVDDVVIGVPYGSGDPVKSFVVFGRTGGFGTGIDLDAVAAGTGGFAIRGFVGAAGRSVAAAGDVNGDGIGDVIIGAPLASGASGAGYLVFGRSGGFGAGIDLSGVAGGAGGFLIRGEAGTGQVGMSVASAGDVNGDGFDDLILGAGNADGAAGRSYVVFGKAGGFGAQVDLASVATGVGGFVILGENGGDQMGRSVASAGDVNGDGFYDLIVAAPTANSNTGKSYVIFGRDFLSTVSHQGTSGNNTLTGTGGADDMVGELGDDVLAGGGGADVLLGGAGDDVVRIGDAGFQRVDGGSGNDTLALGGAGMSLDLTGAIAARLRNIERIDLTGTGNNALVLSKLAALNLSGTSNTVRVLGDAGDSVDLQGAGWTQGATAAGFTTWTNGAATAEVAAALSVACFAEGTRLRTVGGEVAVERLAAGDAVVTASGAVRAVRWVGYRTLVPGVHPRPWDVQPVRVAAGAFGDGAPVRELWLSPDHAVFVAGALVPVRYLLNGTTIVQDSVARVTYFHVELADEADAAVHDVVLAEGMPCESFLDTGNKGAFANGGAAVTLHPDFALRVWETKACAPLVRGGTRLAAVRAALRSRAEALGHAMTTDPDLRLVADGVELAATWDGDVARFEVPAGARAVRLRSRTVVPAQGRVVAEDHRRLGVAVTGLRLDGCTIALDDAMLAEGWHAVEDGLRWTDGDAALPCLGGAVVEVSVAALERYAVAARAAGPRDNPRQGAGAVRGAGNRAAAGR